MREMVLLGAGASVEAGVPAAYEMTPKMLELFGNDWRLREYSRVLRFAVGGLLFQQGIKGDDPFAGINVEDVFNAIDLLARRSEADVAAFVGSWHPLVDELDKVPRRADYRSLYRAIRDSVATEFANAFGGVSRSAGKTEVDKTLEAMAKGRGSSKSLGQAIARLIENAFKKVKTRSPRVDSRFASKFASAAGAQELPGEGRVFEATTELMTQKLVEMVWIEEPARVEHLMPLVGYARDAPVTVATLNYDNAMELATQVAEVPLTTGIDTWARQGEFPSPSEGILLLKLHGSIDWERKEQPSGRGGPFPLLVVEEVSLAAMRKRGHRPAVIFGQRNKLTTEGPFLDLLRAFERELKKSDRLTTIGYSFRDEHVNDFIAQWLNVNREAVLRVVDIRDPRSSRVEFAQLLVKQLADRLEVMKAPASEGIAQCFGPPEVPADETQV